MQRLRPDWNTAKLAHFLQEVQPAHLPTDALRGVAKHARQALLTGVGSSGDKSLDEGVYQATTKEISKGFLQGSIDPEALPGATLTRRFGVVQNDKVRPIDDCRSSMVNASVTQVETVSIHGVDHIAAMCSEYLRISGTTCSFPQLVAKCWDLSAAYKQVPLSDSACQLDGYLVVYNPHTKAAEIYRQQVLPFGSIASVTAFLRCSLAIWHIGSTLLAPLLDILLRRLSQYMRARGNQTRRYLHLYVFPTARVEIV